MFKQLEIEGHETIINVYEIVYLSKDSKGGCLSLKNGALFHVDHKTYEALKELLTPYIGEIVSSELFKYHTNQQNEDEIRI